MFLSSNIPHLHYLREGIDEQCSLLTTHHIDTIQLLWHALVAALTIDSPTRLIVGMIVKGPMNRISVPMKPVHPMNTWTSDARIRPPES